MADVEVDSPFERSAEPYARPGFPERGASISRCRLAVGMFTAIF
jgi:hypothetical protein